MKLTAEIIKKILKSNINGKPLIYIVETGLSILRFNAKKAYKKKKYSKKTKVLPQLWLILNRKFAI